MLVTVTLRTTAATPAGTFALPAIFSLTGVYAPTLAFAAPVPARVSSSRVGACGTKKEPAVENWSWLTAWTWFTLSVAVTVMV